MSRHDKNQFYKGTRKVVCVECMNACSFLGNIESHAAFKTSAKFSQLIRIYIHIYIGTWDYFASTYTIFNHMGYERPIYYI